MRSSEENLINFVQCSISQNYVVANLTRSLSATAVTILSDISGLDPISSTASLCEKSFNFPEPQILYL